MYSVLPSCTGQLIRQYPFVFRNNKRSSVYQWSSSCILSAFLYLSIIGGNKKPELRFHNNVTKKALCPTANNDDADCRGCWTSPKWRSVELVRQHLFNQRRTSPTPAFWYLLQLKKYRRLLVPSLKELHSLYRVSRINRIVKSGRVK